MKTDDPKLTAYALDELDPADRAEVEQLLRENPNAVAEIAEVRSVAKMLESTLHNEEAPPLSTQHREAVMREIPQAKIVKGPSWWGTWQGASVAAACVVFGFGAWAIFHTLTEPRPNYVAAEGKPGNRSAADSAEGVTVSVPAPEPETKHDTLLAGNELPPPAPELIPGAPAAPLAVTMTKQLPTAATIQMPIEGYQALQSEKLSAASISSTTANGSPVTKSVGREGIGTLTLNKDKYNAAAEFRRSNTTPNASQVTAEWQRPYRGRIAASPKTLPPGSYAMIAPKPSGGIKPKPDTRLVAGRNQLLGGFDAKPQPSVDALSAMGDGDAGGNTEAYDAIEDNAFKRVTDEPLSTFSVDVDTASYANVRRMLRDQQRPPHGAVRIEELVNYFNYDYEQPNGDAPFSVNLEVATCPWQPAHRLLRVGLKGKDMARKNRPAANLVFLVDVSGSMNSPGKLPLVKESLQMLVDQMRDQDRVALAVYAGTSGLVQDSTSDKADIRRAIANLEAGGSTNGGSGIQLAYRTAREHLVKDGTNRVILCTDGDFNVGTTSQSELVKLIEKERKGGVFLSVLGFGTGNLKDSTMEKLADKGNGNYAYIDGLEEAKKVLVDQMVGTLVTIAKDVKLQLEFNPAQVGSYRLIGYENRVMAAADFNDDRKDAGEIGAGHTVTALYELVPPGAEKATVDGLKYQPEDKAKVAVPADLKKELLTVKLRYKEPTGDTSKLLEFPLNDSGHKWEQSSVDFRWAASVASFGMILRDSPHRAGANWGLVNELAAEAKGEDRKGYRAEFLKLIDKAKVVAPVKQ